MYKYIPLAIPKATWKDLGNFSEEIPCTIIIIIIIIIIILEQKNFR